MFRTAQIRYLRNKIQNGSRVVGAAVAAEDGQADFLMVLNAGKFRAQGSTQNVNIGDGVPRSEGTGRHDPPSSSVLWRDTAGLYKSLEPKATSLDYGVDRTPE